MFHAIPLTNLIGSNASGHDEVFSLMRLNFPLDFLTFHFIIERTDQKTLMRTSTRRGAVQRAGEGENLPEQQRRMDLGVAG